MIFLQRFLRGKESLRVTFLPRCRGVAFIAMEWKLGDVGMEWVLAGEGWEGVPSWWASLLVFHLYPAANCIASLSVGGVCGNRDWGSKRLCVFT